jgi:hypothetical protein
MKRRWHPVMIVSIVAVVFGCSKAVVPRKHKTGKATTEVAEHPALIPLPREIVWSEESFDLSQPINVVSSTDDGEEIRRVADVLETVLRQRGVRRVKTISRDLQDYRRGCISLVLGPVGDTENNEAYRLEVTGSSVKLTAPQPTGLFWGVQTLRQLAHDKAGKLVLPGCKITDWPAFKWRGIMLDPARNFMTLQFLKEQVEILSRYKMNVLHIHLTDNGSWRLQIKKFPQLTAPRNQISHPGKFYSQAEIREFVAFCKRQHVMVVPEIEMPGHSGTFKRSMKVEMQSEQGVAILKHILEEVCEAFEVPYIHLGTDEVVIWNKDFIPTVEKVVRDCGKKVIEWHPEKKWRRELDNKVVYQLWIRQGPKPGYTYLESRNYYVNDHDPLAAIPGVFNKRVLDADTGSDFLLGAEACVWSYRRLAREKDLVRLNPVYPVLLTLSERTWRGGGYPEFGMRIPDPETSAFKDFVAFEERLIAHRDRYFRQLPFPYVRQSNIVWRITGPFPNEAQLNRSFPPEVEIKDSYDYENTIYTWKEVRGGTMRLDKEFGGIKEDTTAYGLTYVRVAKPQDAFMWIGFQNSPRQRLISTPESGQWDLNEGRGWLNDEPIPAPKWARPGRKMGRAGDIEEPWIDEGYHYRKPAPIRLRAGWNKVLFRVPFGKRSYEHCRWMFTGVVVSYDGGRAKALEGVTYSTKPDM